MTADTHAQTSSGEGWPADFLPFDTGETYDGSPFDELYPGDRARARSMANRSGIMFVLQRWIEHNGISRTAAAAALGTSGTRITSVQQNRVVDVSLDFLLKLVVAAGGDYRIVIEPDPTRTVLVVPPADGPEELERYPDGSFQPSLFEDESCVETSIPEQDAEDVLDSD